MTADGCLHPACQCMRWPDRCWATPVQAGGLCANCIPGNCQPRRPVTPSYADVTHRRAG